MNIDTIRHLVGSLVLENLALKGQVEALQSALESLKSQGTSEPVKSPLAEALQMASEPPTAPDPTSPA